MLTYLTSGADATAHVGARSAISWTWRWLLLFAPPSCAEGASSTPGGSSSELYDVCSCCGPYPLLSGNFSISGFRLTSFALPLRRRGFGGIRDAFGSSHLRRERRSDLHIPFLVDVPPRFFCAC